MRKEKKECGNCRNRVTGWDGGFFDVPLTCECRIFGDTENRKNCKHFKRPYPKGFALLTEFRKWFNEQENPAKLMIEYEDLLRFRREWE